MTLGEQIVQVGLGILDYSDKRSAAKKAASSAQRVEEIRAQADAARAQAEGAAQASALQTQFAMQENLQKWLSWALMGIVVVAVAAIGGGFIAKMFRKRG